MQTDITGRYNFTRQFYGEASFLYRYSDYINSADDEVDHFISPGSDSATRFSGG